MTTGMERLTAALQGETCDRIPVFCTDKVQHRLADRRTILRARVRPVEEENGSILLHDQNDVRLVAALCRACNSRTFVVLSGRTRCNGLTGNVSAFGILAEVSAAPSPGDSFVHSGFPHCITCSMHPNLRSRKSP